MHRIPAQEREVQGALIVLELLELAAEEQVAAVEDEHVLLLGPDLVGERRVRRDVVLVTTAVGGARAPLAWPAMTSDSARLSQLLSSIDGPC